MTRAVGVIDSFREKHSFTVPSETTAQIDIKT
jgi:hypothetical protein